MRLYFVGPPSGGNQHYVELMSGRRVLHSYGHDRSIPIPSTVAGYCLDSGAWTTWKKGRLVDLDKLCAWYDAHPAAEFKLMLDIMGGTEQQQRDALNEMERRGQKVTPVFHGPGAESWKWFDELCERYPLVAVGSLLPRNTMPEATDWLDRIFRRVCGPDGIPRRRIHGLRMPIRAAEYPFDSVDGSTWITASKNGRMPTRFGRQTQATPGLSTLDLMRLWVEHLERMPKATRFLRGNRQLPLL